MIRYALACDNGHNFESWFPSSTSYDAQAERGLVACPVCGSAKIEKRLMTPALGASKRAAAAGPVSSDPAPSPESAPPPAMPPQLAIMSEREAAMRSMLRAIREHVVKTADYVGPQFADEARKMHYGEIEHRSIYGEANATEARELIDEGIEVHPLPINPDDRN